MRLFILSLVLSVAGSTASGQGLRLTEADPAEVMVLGTFHFANPNLDAVQMAGIDVFDADRQAEIAGVLDDLAAFAPTRVAVEVPLGPEADSLQARYDRYRGGGFELPASETYQLGFRLGERLGHDGVYPVDYRVGLRFDSLMAYASPNDPAFMGWFQGYIAGATEMLDRIQAEESIGANLRYMNTPQALALVQQLYAKALAVGAGDGYVGARVVAQWYDRNLRIFGNLAALATPGERVLLVIGQGHAPILRQLVRDHPGMRLVEPNDYLFP